MDDVEGAITTLRDLKALGIKIAVDDFGTGFSSLAYLRRFPLDELKVDKSFVDGLGRDPESTAIVAAVVGMAHALQLTVVAEGVETREQESVLRDLGCDEVQGYLFARPLAADEEAMETVMRSRTLVSADNPVAGSGTSVVIVDDAADIRQLVRASLASAGFAVRESDRADKGLDLIRWLLPDCVILDRHMPGGDGLEICRLLREDPLTSSITIVIMTGDALASDKVEAFALGADDYIVKPFTPRDLVSRVAAAVRRRHGQ